ncbi:MAG: gas vesicle protein [Candidatus Methanoperedens sp.]|nr:gas vesicle protein [Candidatus Methanoperedens sp.]MCE8426121.1 gas vesicle protein [Candidatus Methanoperedens sp.]MCE8428537.1 gas vesicle protein [Candidatus Methanoperedens sp.]
MEKKPHIKESIKKKPDIKEISKLALSLTESIVNKKVEGITSMNAEDEGWKVNVEVLERIAVPDTQDLLSTYELKLTCDGEITGYKRTTMRKRGDRVTEALE